MSAVQDKENEVIEVIQISSSESSPKIDEGNDSPELKTNEISENKDPKEKEENDDVSNDIKQDKEVDDD
eukprot:UN06804